MRNSSRLDLMHSINLSQKVKSTSLSHIQLDLYLILFTIVEYHFPIIWYLTPISNDNFQYYKLLVFILFVCLVIATIYNLFVYADAKKNFSTFLNNLSDVQLDGSFYYGPNFYKTPTKNRSLSFSDSFKLSSTMNKGHPDSGNNSQISYTNSTQLSPINQNCSLFQLAFSPISRLSSSVYGNNDKKSKTGINNSLFSNAANPKPYQVSIPLKNAEESFENRKEPSNIRRSSSSYMQSQTSPSRAFKERSLDQYWKLNSIDKDTLDRWTLNLRRWIHGTIFKRISNEISKANSKISSIHHEFMSNNHFNMVNPIGLESKVVVGKSSPEALMSASKTFASYSSNNQNHQNNLRNLSLNLSILSEFLNCSPDQEYVANRIKELSHGVCLEEFHWNNGSKSILHTQYNDTLPNDTIILLHLFSVYMDTRIPVSVSQIIHDYSNTSQALSANQSQKEENIINSVHSVKPFSKTFIHGLKSAISGHKTNSSGDNMFYQDLVNLKSRNKYDCILQLTSNKPPKFKLFIENEIYYIPEGPNAIFHGLLAFFYYYHKLDNRIRLISLGDSGLNISWIFKK